MVKNSCCPSPLPNRSENDLQRKLHLSGEIIRYDLSQPTVHLLARLVELGIRVNLIELRMVKRVERFDAKFYSAFFPEWKILEYADIEVLNSRAADDTGGGIARICPRRRLDHTGIEKSIEASVAFRQVNGTGDNAAAVISTPEKVHGVCELAIQAGGTLLSNVEIPDSCQLSNTQWAGRAFH
jgi:hypothetical protein